MPEGLLRKGCSLTHAIAAGALAETALGSFSHCVLSPRSASGTLFYDPEPLATVLGPGSASGTLFYDPPKLPFGSLKRFLGLGASEVLPKLPFGSLKRFLGPTMPLALPQSHFSKPSSTLMAPPARCF